MELSNKTKLSELGHIPADWNILPIEEVAQIKNGLTYSPSNVSENGTLVLRSSNIQDDRLSFTNNVFVNCSVPEKNKVEEGDILICVRNGSRNLIGKCALIDKRADGEAFGAFMAVLRSDISDYLIWQFRSSIMQQQINEHLGATINQITNGSLKAFKVILPSLTEEQEAIAEALSDADALIASLEKLIEKKSSIQAAQIHELTSGELRLPNYVGEWEHAKLGDIGKFRKGRGIPRSEANSGNLRAVRYGELYTTHDNLITSYASFISEKVAASSIKLNYGDQLFAGSGEKKEEIGKSAAFVEHKEAYAGGDIVIYSTTSIDPIFCGYALNSEVVRKQKESAAQGDAVVHIYSQGLADISVSFPKSRDEQVAIGNVLKLADNELAILSHRLSKAKKVKAGMMQELLTGRTRLI